MDRKHCQDCGITWENPDETIYGHFLNKGMQNEYSEDGYTQEQMDRIIAKAVESAGNYGATEENGMRFKTNMYIVEYGYESDNHYDGWSETFCTSCKARRGRWTNNILQDGEEEPRFGGK